LTLAFSFWISSSPPHVQRQWRTVWTSTILFPLQVVVGRMHLRWNLQREMDEVRLANAKLIATNAKLSEIAEMQGSFRNSSPSGGGWNIRSFRRG